MFERFTERARQVLVLAQDEARLLKHNYIGTEHILLGLFREDEGFGFASRVLESLDITVEQVRAQVARIVGQGDQVTIGEIPFTPRAKKVLELALREAVSLGHNYIGTEHLLLGLVRESEGVAARILVGFGADGERIGKRVFAMLPESATAAEEMAMPSEAALIPPGLLDEIDRVRREKEDAALAQDFKRAGAAWRRERRLLRRAGVEEVAPSGSIPAATAVAARTVPLLGNGRLAALALLAAATLLGIGIMIGWAIWG